MISRLIDNDPMADNDILQSNEKTITTIHAEVRDNLEALLNSRKSYVDWPKSLLELKRSHLNYGILDFVGASFSNRAEQLSLCNDIKSTIEYFEPRLSNISVTMVANDLDIERELKIRISAVLNIAAEPVQTVFESTLDILTHQFLFKDY